MVLNNFLRKKEDGSQRVILNLKFLNETIDKYNLKFLQYNKNSSGLFSWGSVWISGSAARVSRFPTYLYQTSQTSSVVSQVFRSHSVGIHWWYFLAGRYRTGLSECSDGNLSSFGFLRLYFHPVKSVLQPTQRIDFLGFWLGLINMIVSLTDRKVDKIRSLCAELLEMEVCSIRHMAKIIGYLVAAHLDGWVAPVFYIRIEIAKNAALSETVVILVLPWEFPTLFRRTFYGGPIMWIISVPCSKE